jgi:hypothetical protein
MSRVLPAAKPDAVMCSLDYPRLRPGQQIEAAVRDEFASVLGVPTVWTRQLAPLGKRLISGDPNATHSHPLNSDYPGVSRYVWIDRGDGVELGYLTKEAKDALAGPAKVPAALVTKEQADALLDAGAIDVRLHQTMLDAIAAAQAKNPEAGSDEDE